MKMHKIKALAAACFIFTSASGAMLAMSAPASASTTETFPIKICGHQVTTENMNNILDDGTASYRFDGDHTLTVCTYPGSGLTETQYSGTEPIIYSELDGLVITTINSPIITSKNDAIVLTENTTLKACSLNIYANRTAIFIKNGKKLTISDGSEINVKESTFGITGNVGGESLEADSSRLDVTSATRAVCFFTGGITLNNCHIAQPEGGKIGRSTIDEPGDAAAVRVVVIPTRGEMRSFDGSKTLTWEYAPSRGEVTAEGDINDDTPLIAASYDENGVLLKAAMIADENAAAATGIGASRIKLLRWSMSDLSPLCPAAEIRLTEHKEEN